MEKKRLERFVKEKNRPKKIFRVVRLTFFLCLCAVTSLFASVETPERITMNLGKSTVKNVLNELQKQTKKVIMYNDDRLHLEQVIEANFVDVELENLLNRILTVNGMGYKLVDNYIVIVPLQKADSEKQPQTVKELVISGRVTDDKKVSLPGVTVLIKGTTLGTSTDHTGKFTLKVVESDKLVLVFSFVGMETKEVEYTGQQDLNVQMEYEVANLEEVVVTGIFERKTESFTGSASTYKTEDLKMMGTQNVLQSLRTLDPSFHITPNNQFGSDPNKLPDIDIRGKTSVVNLKEEYETDPNQPLFILDGFEVPLQTIVDLNMERVASVTILKDAASTAIYGSRAANGVVVIETKKPTQGSLRLSYNGNFSVQMPDLSDYNMMNAAEKLEFERLTGYYSASDQVYHFNLQRLYNERLSRVQSGVDTYWLSEPVRTGFSHKHNLYLEGGDNAMLYGVGISYAGTEGVMKESGRDVLSFNMDLRYRKGKFRFDNKFTLDYTESENAPQSFSVYVQTNPYYEKDYEGSVPKYLEDSKLGLGSGGHDPIKRANPLYNASLNNLNETKELGFRNNFQMEWRPVEGLVTRARISLNKSNYKEEIFKSPFHSDFDETEKTERGSYQKSMRDRWSYDGDVTVTFGKLLAEKHQVNVVAGWRYASNRSVNDAYTAIGFPDDNVPNPAFANQYAASSKPSYSESTARSTSFYVNGNYSFANRYLLDFNFREDGSSVFGVNKRFTGSWSVGVAWNIHNEAFMGDWADLLKIRFSVGNPGNQNFSSYKSYTTYAYNTVVQNMFGMGAEVSAYGNPDLKWQKTIDYNLGADISLFNNYLKINADVYYKNTDPLLITSSIASSTGRDDYVTNMGATKTRGISLSTIVTLINWKERALRWTVSWNGRHQVQEYDKIGNSLDLLNAELKKSSLQRYRDGGSPTDIWAVRSAGIDPMTGEEVFIKKDGTYSFIYDNNDEVIVGNTEAKLEGVFGTTVYYKGFSLSAHFRYRFGADYFNRELYNRIENILPGQYTVYNQDRRALYDRWQKPGDHARYRRITSTVQENQTYPMTDRYVQRERTLSGESISISYDFGQQKWLQAIHVRNMTLRANMNDIFRCSTLRAERGISYPFARTVSFSLNATF